MKHCELLLGGLPAFEAKNVPRGTFVRFRAYERAGIRVTEERFIADTLYLGAEGASFSLVLNRARRMFHVKQITLDGTSVYRLDCPRRWNTRAPSFAGNEGHV